MRLFVMLALLCFASGAVAEPLKFLTEEYPPYAVRADGGYSGIGVDQVKAIAATAGIDYTMEMMPWARALALAESQPQVCIFAAAHNAERDAKFKWVEPLLIDRNFLVAKRGSGVTVHSLDDAKRFIVGTQREDYTDALLKTMGFPKIDLASDFNTNLKKLLAGRIDLMPMSQSTYEKLRSEGTEIESATLFSEQKLGIACHTDAPDAAITALQAALDRLIASGEQDRIFRKYGVEPLH